MNKVVNKPNRKKYLNEAETFLEHKQVRKALDCYESLLKADPNFIRSHNTHIAQIGNKINTDEQTYNEYVSLYPQIIQNASSCVKRTTSVSNIYHCSIPKAATRWLKKILFDFRIHKYSGLLPWLPEFNLYNNNIPANTIVTGTFTLPYEELKVIREAGTGKSKVFFVMRDPRDVLVSAYFSHKYSHKADGHIKETREILNRVSKEEGLIYNIKILAGVYHILRSWKDASLKEDNDFLLIKYEDLTGPDSFASFKNLFEYCEVDIPEKVLANVLKDYSFDQLSRGRPQGTEDSNSHYRKGVQGDWKNHFNAKIRDQFEAVAGDLVTYLGYEWDGENELGKDYKSKVNNREAISLATEPQASVSGIDKFINRNLQLGNQHYQENKLDEAATHYNNILEKVELPLATSLFYLALINFRKKELEQAQDLFFKAVTIDSQLVDAYFYLGKINLDLQEYLKSIEFLKQHTLQRPDAANTHFYLGLAYFKSGNFDSAISTFNKVLELNPDLPDTYFYIGETYMKQQNIKEGVKHHDIYKSMKN